MTSLWLQTHPIPELGTPLDTTRHHDVAVVGAGLTGVTTALLLAAAGQRTVLLEARTVGAVATGNTTGKVSLLQGTVLSQLRKVQGDEALNAYVAANLAAQAWLVQHLESAGTIVQRRTAFTYANSPGSRSRLDAEHEACVAAGLPVRADASHELPYDVAGAIALPEQFQVHPTRALDALLGRYLAAGGVLHTGHRVLDVQVSDDACRVATDAGSIHAGQVVLATGTPILDRGGHFARLRAERSYAAAFMVPGPIPQGMYLSIDEPSRSLRTASVPGGEALVVGGNGHPVGRHQPTGGLVEDLSRWTAEAFPGATQTHAWSAQDYAPSAAMPWAGVLPWSKGRVLAATGYHKWGMTNAVASALRLVAALGGPRPDWASALNDADRPGVAGVAEFSTEVVGQLANGWLGAELHGLGHGAPPEADGVVGRLNGAPAARSTVSGRTCTLSAVCTHLGGVVTWNDAEQSWDCPLHGSRFDASGHVLEGPAVADLAQLD